MILKLEDLRSQKMMICSELLDAGHKEASVNEIFSSQNKRSDVSACLYCDLQFPQLRRIER